MPPDQFDLGHEKLGLPKNHTLLTPDDGPPVYDCAVAMAHSHPALTPSTPMGSDPDA